MQLKGMVLQGVLVSADAICIGSNILKEYEGKFIRINIDEAKELVIQRGDVYYTVRMFPDNLEVIRTEGQVSTVHTFHTDEIGPEHAAGRRYRSALDTVLTMLDDVDKPAYHNWMKTHGVG